MRELHVLFGEASSVLSKRFSRFLLAVAEIPQIAEVDVGSLEVSLKHLDQIGPIMDLVSWELLEPPACGVGEEERELPDDGSIVSTSASQLVG
jgi:hypothetical protein